MKPLQSLSSPSQISSAPGLTVSSSSSQSPSQVVQPSLSRSKPSSMSPSPSLSMPSQTSSEQPSASRSPLKGKWWGSPLPVRDWPMIWPSKLPLLNVMSAQGASIEPCTPMALRSTVRASGMFQRIWVASTPLRKKPKLDMDTAKPSTLMSTVELAGTEMETDTATARSAESRSKTFVPAEVPSRSMASQGCTVVVPLAGRLARLVEVSLSSSSAAAKSMGLAL